MYAIEFLPPLCGFEGEYNTFRLGIKWSKRLKVGDKVMLLDKRNSYVFGVAIVVDVVVGKLGEMARLYAAKNHSQRGLDEPGAPDRLIDAMMRLYGPHIVTVEKKVTVIRLKGIENELSAQNDLFGHVDVLWEVQRKVRR